MKYLLFFLAITCLYSKGTAQDLKVVRLDSLTISTRNVQDESEMLPLPESHPDYKESKVEVTIEFTVTNIGNLKSIEINFEKEKGKKDFKSFHLAHVVAEGKSYLTLKNKSYEIINSKVTITEQVPASFIKRKIYFSVKGIDKEQKSSNVITREFN